MTGLPLPAHLGQLHAYEHILVWLFAFGPFLVLFVVVYLVRKRDLAEEERDQAAQAFPVSPRDPSG